MGIFDVLLVLTINIIRNDEILGVILTLPRMLRVKGYAGKHYKLPVLFQFLQLLKLEFVTVKLMYPLYRPT